MHFCWWSATDSLVSRLQTYIDFEISEGNRDRARKLYERLLARTKHVKVRTDAPPTSGWQQLLVTITLVPEDEACSSGGCQQLVSQAGRWPQCRIAGAVELVVWGHLHLVLSKAPLV